MRINRQEPLSSKVTSCQTGAGVKSWVTGSSRSSSDSERSKREPSASQISKNSGPSGSSELGHELTGEIQLSTVLELLGQGDQRLGAVGQVGVITFHQITADGDIEQDRYA